MNPIRTPSALHQTSDRPPLALRLGLGVLGLVLGISLVVWGLRLSRPQETVSAPVQAPIKATSPDAMAKALAVTASSLDASGTSAASGTKSDGQAPEPSRPAWRLLGVMVQADGQGSALLAGDGQSAKSWRVGQTLPDGLVVLRVHANGVELGDAKSGQVSERLKLPAAPSVPVTSR